MNRQSVIDEIITRQYYDETGSVKYNQVLLTKHLVPELLESLHGKANKHPGLSKMLRESRQKNYHPGIAKIVKKWVQGCEICIKDERIPNSSITPQLINLTEWDLGPEEAKQTCPPVEDTKTSQPQWTWFQDICLHIQSLTLRSQTRLRSL